MHKGLVVVMLSLTLGISGVAVASPATPFIKALSRWLAKEFGQEGAGKLGKGFSKEMLERFTAKVIKEGGEKSLEQVSVLVAKHGPDVVRALDNAPAVTPILRALDELPAEQIPKALARLAGKTSGRELAETTARYGVKTLTAELRHPGIGGRFLKLLGDDGASLCGKLTKDQGITVGRHLDDIAKLPPTQKNAILEVFSSQTDRMCRFLGEFAQKNPGKVLFTSGATALVLTNAERLFGGDEIVFDDDGKPHLISKPGFFERSVNSMFDMFSEDIKSLIRGVAIVLIVALASYSMLKLYGVWQTQRLAIRNVSNHKADRSHATASPPPGSFFETGSTAKYSWNAPKRPPS